MCGVLVRAALAAGVCLSRLRPGPRSAVEEPGAHLRMPRLRSPDVDHGRDGDAPVEVAADGVVLGRASHGDALEWPLEGVVEVDQAEIPFRADNSFFDPAKSGKILIAGAVEVIDRGTNQAKPRRKRAKYLDTRSGRIRLAAIPDNSAASIEAFVRANVKPGTTLVTDGHAAYPGLSGDYRHDPRVVGNMAANVVLPWSHRAFSLLKRWALGTYHGLRRKHVDAYLDE